MFLSFHYSLLTFNRPELIQQSLNKQSISNALNSARSTVNSWFTNLGSTLQAKAATAGTSGWSTYIGNTVGGGGGVLPTAKASNENNGKSKTSSTTVAASQPKLPKKETEKESFVFYPDNEDTVEEDETSV